MVSVADTYDRTDNASSLGGDWIVTAGTWGITGNKAYCVTAGGTPLLPIAWDPTGDIRAQADVTHDANAPGVTLISNSTANSRIGIQLLSTTFRRFKIESGSYNFLGAEVSYSFTNGVVYAVRLELDSNNVLRTFINDTEVGTPVTLTSGEVTNLRGSGMTYTGLTVDVAGTARFDNFLAYEAQLTEVRPGSTVTSTGWTVSGAATHHQAVNEDPASDTEYVQGVGA